LTDQEHFYLTWLVDEFSFPLKELENNNNAFVFAFDYVNSIIDSQSYIHLNYLVDIYVKPLMDCINSTCNTQIKSIRLFYIPYGYFNKNTS
jgi:hypothetical protein